MKKILFVTALVCFTSLIFAQTSQRVSAYNYLKDGDLDLAKEAIDKCVLHTKTSTDARAWLYYGQIYHAIAISKDKAYMNLDPKSEIKAYDGYKKAILFNFIDQSYWDLDIDNNQMDMIKFSKALMNKDTKYVDEGIVIDVFANRYPPLSNALVNKGLTEYQDNNNYAGALELFERSLFTSSMVGKVDTQAVYLCALAAVKGENTKKAIEYYTVLNQLEYGEKDEDKANNYYFLAKQYLNQNDTAKYVKTLQDGISKYPNSSSAIVVEMINYYLSKKQQKEALLYLEKGIESSPTNASLYYAKGTIYDTDSIMQDKDKAIEAYKKAIELEPKHFDAYYNLGAIYYNKGAAKNEEAKAVDPDNFKKYKLVKAEADEFFKQSLPFLEKAHEINQEDLPTMQSLKLVYYRIGDMEKHDAIKAKMDGK